MVGEINYKRSLFFCLLLLLSASYSRAEIPTIAPRYEVQMEQNDEGEEKPLWKQTWDTARSFARSDKLDMARIAYQQLLSSKPNIAEAKWEYGKLLIRLRDWDESSQVIEGLLDLEPNNLEYLSAAGTIALQNSHYSKVIKYFGQVYETDPTGRLSAPAITGMIAGFKALGNKKSAFLLLEQKYHRHPENMAILEELAMLAQELGRYDRAGRFFSQLVERFPLNKEYIFRAAQIFDALGHKNKALKYWRKYVEIVPNYLPFHRKLANYYLDRDSAEQALPHLQKLYTQDYLATDLAIRIAEIYNNELGRPDKALLYYEQYLNVFVNDIHIANTIKEIRKKLAHEYLPIVENNGAERLWQDLQLITQNRAEIFFQMVDLFAAKEKTEQQISLLQILSNARNTDLDLIYRLAQLNQRIGNLDKALSFIATLDDKGYERKEYLVAKANILLLKKREIEALQSLHLYLQVKNQDASIAEQALKLAGSLGLIEEVENLWQLIPPIYKNSIDYLELNLAYITSLRKNGRYDKTEGLYRELLKQSNNKEALVKIYFHMADTTFARGHIFEAEQIIRQVLVRNLAPEKAFTKLVRLAIEEGRTALANIWLALLVDSLGYENLADSQEILPENVHFLNVDILVAEKEYDEAIDRLSEHTLYLPEQGLTNAFTSRSNLYLAGVYLLEEDYWSCLRALKGVGVNERQTEEFYVLNDLATKRIGNDAEAAKEISSSERSAVAFTALLQRSIFYRKYGDNSQALDMVDKALQILPESLTAMLNKINILTSLAKYTEALAIVDNATAMVPDQEYFEKLKLQLEFKSGNFKKIVERVTVSEKPQEEKTDLAGTPNSENMYFWKKLLLARALWAENRREEAIRVYDSLLAEPVDTTLLKKMEIEKINYHLPPLKKSFWNVLTFSNPEGVDQVSTIMTPQFVAQNIGQPVDDIAASLYGQYRWQNLIRKELSAKQAVKQHDYYRAEKEFLALVEDEKSEEALFDLAYIYDKLGLYGKAAELYELMKDTGPLYPGLDESIKANVLKRQPRISTTIENDVKQGRDGYINLKKRSYGIESWIMPSYDQELSLSLFRNNYSAYGNSSDTSNSRAIATYSTYFENTTDLNISFGLDMPDATSSNELLYKFELIWRANRSLESYGRFEQDLVEDTLRSVTDSIIYRDMEAGVKFDLFPRWFVGADYRYRVYSDDNQQNRYKLWSMYHLFGEVNQFKVKYSYENIRNHDENTGTKADNDNYRSAFDIADRVYWSPDLYWQHVFTIHFKHFFEIQGQFDDPLSYCSFDYSYGFEEDNQHNHEFDVNIFLEINNHFLLKGNLNNQNGQDYEETQATLSLIYRW